MAVVLAVQVQPRASKNAIVRTDGQPLRVRVTAPPADGRANRQVVELLAKVLKIGRGRISIVAGLKSRNKRVRIEGLDAAEVQALLPV